MSFDITTRVESPGTEIVDASEDNTVPDASQSVAVISAESDPSIFAIIKVFTFNTLLELAAFVRIADAEVAISVS